MLLLNLSFTRYICCCANYIYLKKMKAFLYIGQILYVIMSPHLLSLNNSSIGLQEMPKHHSLVQRWHQLDVWVTEPDLTLLFKWLTHSHYFYLGRVWLQLGVQGRYGPNKFIDFCTSDKFRVDSMFGLLGLSITPSHDYQ